MLQLILRRIGMMILIMLVVALLLFMINEGDPRLIARSVLGPYAQADQLQLWIEQNGYDRSMFIRYFEWLGRVMTGDLGHSIIYKRRWICRYFASRRRPRNAIGDGLAGHRFQRVGHRLDGHAEAR